MRIWVRVFAVVATLPFWVGGRADGCSCESRPPCVAYEQADAVFVGRVLDISRTMIAETVVEGQTSITLLEEGRLVRFALEQPFKGVKGAETEVETEAAGCGYGFKEGNRYLVYAYRSRESARLSTGLCSRTQLAGGAGDDLEYLQGLPDSSLQTRISGTIEQTIERADGTEVEVPLGGVRVIVRGTTIHQEALSDAQGVYRIIGLPPGQYTVRAVLPGNLTPTNTATGDPEEITVKLPEGGCAAADAIVKGAGITWYWH